MDATPTLQDLDDVLAYIPCFEDEQSHFYDLQTEPLTMDPYSYSPKVEEFVGTLGRAGFIVPFDWPAWQSEAARYEADPSLLDSAGVPTLRKLLTTYVRADRFNSGYLAYEIERGQILAILRRLKAIRDTMAKEQA